MMQLYRYIGSDTDIPSGDLGVGEREIGFLYGEYKRLTGRYESNALTGKGTKSGGSEFKKEAAGCGAIYFLQRMLADNNDSIEGKTIAVSGFGNLAWGVCRKAALLGAKVVTLSGPDGYIYDPAGIGSEEKLDFVLAMTATVILNIFLLLLNSSSAIVAASSVGYCFANGICLFSYVKYKRAKNKMEKRTGFCMEVLEEKDITDKTVGIAPVGCSIAAPRFMASLMLRTGSSSS